MYPHKTTGRIEPDWHPGLAGTHTFNFTSELVVVDGKLYLPPSES